MHPHALDHLVDDVAPGVHGHADRIEVCTRNRLHRSTIVAVVARRQQLGSEDGDRRAADGRADMRALHCLLAAGHHHHRLTEHRQRDGSVEVVAQQHRDVRVKPVHGLEGSRTNSGVLCVLEVVAGAGMNSTCAARRPDRDRIRFPQAGALHRGGKPARVHRRAEPGTLAVHPADPRSGSSDLARRSRSRHGRNRVG